MSDNIPSPKIDTTQKNEAVKAQGYLNYIGETRVYFLLPSLGWELFYDVSDQAFKEQILTAFANPDNFEVYVFYQGTTVNSIQVKCVLPQ